MVFIDALLFALKALYLFLPAGFANMAPPFFRDMRFLDCPVDFGHRWKGKTLFGSHKTWRGVFFGTLIAIITVFIQKILFLDYPVFRGISLLDYSAVNFVLLGFLLGFGALLGDIVKSFMKRRAGIAPGNPWIPFDQIDFILGSLALLCFVYIPSWQTVLFLLVAIPILHIFFNHVGYYMGINKNKW
ncbi:CDP-archaeol synthase [Candidatus Woesearchaeota archaeon]|nr:CDP-archaeol synthase [Candidatus Woesearchaeota archaeon]